MSKKGKGNVAVLVAVCGVFFLIAAIGSLILYSHALELRLDNVLQASLISHTIESGEDARQMIDNTRALLEDAVRLLEEDGRKLSRSWAVPLINAVNLGGRQQEINYLDLDDLASAEPGSEEQRVFQQLQEGVGVVGGLIPSQDESDFYFLVVQPVEQDGQLSGAVQARVDAGTLFRQGHDSALFNSVHRVIAGDDGRVVCGSVENTRGLSLSELARRDGLSQKDAERFVAVYQADENGSFRYDTKQGRGYSAWAPISYNGWRIVQFSQSPSLRVEHYSIVQTVILVISLAVCAVMAVLIRRQRATLAQEKLRYSALSQFKDTLIFEYDCAEDNLEFTSNALETLDLEETRLEHVTDMRNSFPVFHPDDVESLRRALWSADHMEKGQLEHDHIRLKRRDGEYSWYRSQYKPVFDSGGRVIRLIGTLTDISAQIDREIELRKQAQQDALTGVYNRAGVKLINARLEQISRGILFMLDLDNFKHVNDTYGHAAGDRLLTAIGGVLRDTFRTDDIVARVGGDEFVAFLSGSDNRATAEQKGQELLDRVRELKLDGVDLTISVSVGAASAPAHGRTYEALSMAADQAMYQVKHNGKGGFLLI